jgi:CheY-like chemotaxis protein
MSVKGPIIIAEDDYDEREILQLIFQRLGVQNELKFFDNGQLILDYLIASPVKPFIIISDINLPLMNGLELRTAIHNNPVLRRKSIPFIFLSTTANEAVIERAYEMTVQGFFVKQNTLKEIEDRLRAILDYWSNCLHPED